MSNVIGITKDEWIDCKIKAMKHSIMKGDNEFFANISANAFMCGILKFALKHPVEAQEWLDKQPKAVMD